MENDDSQDSLFELCCQSVATSVDVECTVRYQTYVKCKNKHSIFVSEGKVIRKSLFLTLIIFGQIVFSWVNA